MRTHGKHSAVAGIMAIATTLTATASLAQYAPPGVQPANPPYGQNGQNFAPGYGQPPYGQSAAAYQPPPTYYPPQAYGQPSNTPQSYTQPPYTQVPYAQAPYTQPMYGTVPPGTQPAYPAVARAQTEAIPSPDASEGQSSVLRSGQAVNGSGSYAPTYPMTNGAAPDYSSPTPAVDNHGYPTTTSGYTSHGGAGCTDGTTAGYGCGYGSYAACGTDEYGVGEYFDCDSGPRCFVGIYGLFLERDDSTKVNTAVLLDTSAVPSYPYYPPAPPAPAVLRVDSTDDVDFDWQGGAEIRFGGTFGYASFGGSSCGTGCDAGYGCGYGGYGSGYGSSDTCGYDCGCSYQPYGWEVAYWGLAENVNDSLRTDEISTTTTRMYSMIDYFGLEYDRDSGGGAYAYRPLPDYYGTAPPIQAPVPATDPIPVAFRTRTSFSAHNLEVNFLRLPVLGGTGICGVNCGCGACSGASPCTVAGLFGVRYMRFDDDFFNAVQFADPVVGDPGYDGFYSGAPETELFHEINVDNHLTGFQAGCNVDYAVNCSWTLFCYSNFGVFYNHISHYQRVFENGAGNIRFVTDQSAAAVDTDKDDVAFLGELRCGAAYQISCNCRLTAAYRVVGVGGVALSVDQIRPFVNPQLVGRVDSQGSLLLHGLQVGSEFKF